VKKSLELLVLMLSLASFNAHAESYVGLQYTTIKMSTSVINEANPVMGVLRVGKYISPNTAFEFRYGANAGEDTTDENIYGLDMEVSIKSAQGIYALQSMDLTSGLSMYGVLGYTEGEAKGIISGARTIEEFSDLSYGVGMDLKMGESMSLNSEWRKYARDSNMDIDGFNAGLTLEF
jgi:outer membrane immunogenic protein